MDVKPNSYVEWMLQALSLKGEAERQREAKLYREADRLREAERQARQNAEQRRMQALRETQELRDAREQREARERESAKLVLNEVKSSSGKDALSVSLLPNFVGQSLIETARTAGITGQLRGTQKAIIFPMFRRTGLLKLGIKMGNGRAAEGIKREREASENPRPEKKARVFECCVCLEDDEARGCTALGCGHVLCGICSNLCKICPMCQTPVTSLLKIYL